VASAPLPSGSSSSSSSAVGFCIYCANPVPPGTRACPSCGHTLPQW
jgi:predicted amidophosphoribosyltransferase